MTDKKFTDEEIIKRLERCVRRGNRNYDTDIVLDLINRQKSEIERLENALLALMNYLNIKCNSFTNRSEWVHLPCKVEDNVYCIFENKVCIANVLAFYIDKVGIICELKISLNRELPTAPASVCHIDRDSYTNNDIYLTREEAEKALEEKK